MKPGSMTYLSSGNEQRLEAVRSRTLVAGALAIVAVFAGVLYFARDPEQGATQAAQSAESGPAGAAGETTSATPPAASHPAADPRYAAAAKKSASDPRLAVFAVSADNGMIEFVKDSEGKVIREIDRDPGSPNQGKPLRDYSYAGGQVVALTAYKYLGDHVQIVRTAVSFHPDGSVDQFRESTSYDYGKGP